MEIIKTEEFEQDGQIFIRETYDNGTTVEYGKPDPNMKPPEPEPMPEPITLEQLDKQQKEIIARLDAMGGGDTVAVSTLDDAYTKGVNSVE